MSEPKLCCNCLHCARWRTKKGIEYHCDLDDKYLGYLQVMDENDCDKWEKETKWDLEREHDKQIRADAIDEFKNIWDERVKDLIDWCKDKRLIGLQQADFIFDEIAEQLKEKKK